MIMARDTGTSWNMLPTGKFDHLKVKPGDLCWWCQARPATTGEHKYKRTDLARLMGDASLVWVGDGTTRDIRGKSGIKRDRYGVVKFPKFMCDTCNNAQSQPFDRAYDTFSTYLTSSRVRIMPGVSLGSLYGEPWKEGALNLARYYGKHFGCRMVRSGLPVPASLRAFLDGAEDMPDAHMALVTTDTVHRQAGKGLSMSSDYVTADPDLTHFRSYVMAAYVGSVGVRYQWWAGGGRPEGWDSQFFHYPSPILNCFRNEEDLMIGQSRRPGWFARFAQWLNDPSDR